MTRSLPSFFIPHGGGPCFFMDWNPPHVWDKMADWLRRLPDAVGERPEAILVVSGHWEEDAFTLGSNPQPPLIYDYYGFPPHTYALTYAAPGAPKLAQRTCELLASEGFPARLDPECGFDHGVFIPFKVIYPEADIPIVQMSLKTGLDPAEHIAAGRALAPLRDEGVLIVGSGMSYHNLRKFMGGAGGNIPESDDFDAWLTAAATAPDAHSRSEQLARWQDAPFAREVHPEEEHLIPLMVAAGAAGNEQGRRIFSDRVMGAMISAYQFG